MKDKRSNFKTPAFAAIALAFASFGDAILYPYLPMHSVDLGIPLMWVGVLLSINRFVRIFSNTIVVNLFSHYGVRSVTIVAVIVAIFSTAGYGFASGVAMWVLLRILWGVSFSVLRISTIAYALHHPQQGLALGVSKGLQESGPMITLFLAPLLLTLQNPSVIFFILAIASFPALYFAWSLPETSLFTKKKIAPLKSILRFPSAINLMTFTFAFLVDGLVIIGLGVLILHHKHEITPVSAVALAATYLGYRRVCLLLLSIAGGWIADKVGLTKIFMLSTAFTLLGLVILSWGWIEMGALILFTFYSIQSTLTPGSVSNQNDHPLFAVAENATWRDVGAAMGTLSCSFLLSSTHLPGILLMATFAVMIFAFFYFGTLRKTVNFLLSWK